MADLVAIDNQRDASLLSPSAPVEPVMDDSKPGMIADKLSAANDTDELTDNQLTHENTDASEEDDTEEDGEDTIRQSDVDRRLTWIGEGLLNGEGLDAVEQLMNLPSVPSPPKSPIADVATNANEAPMRVERSGSKLLDFLAKEEGYVPNQTPTVANVRAPPPATPTPTPTPTKEATSPTKETKRANKLLDFLATEVGERYLDDVYADEDREDEQEQPEPTPTAPTPKEPGHANNKLLAFLAKERGERLHEVEKIDTTPRPEPYGVTLRFETADANADANTDADKPAPISSTEPTPTETKLVEPSAERNRLAEFVKNVQPPSRPKFVIFNPDDLVSSSSSSSEGEGEGDDSSSSPTGHVKELKLKKRSTQGRVRFANPGLDIQSGVVRQGIVDHYGREELLDFVVQVDEKSLPHAVPEPPVERTPTPPPRHESPTPTPTRRESPPPVPTPPRRESPPPVAPQRRESPTPTPTPTEQPTPTVVAPPPGRLAAFLRKFSSKGDAKNKSGSEHGSSRGSSHSNSPDVRTRHSTPPPSLLPPAPVDAQRRVPPPPPSAHQMPAFQVRTSVESEPETATPVERKIGGVSSMFAPSPRSVLSSASANDSSDKRLQLLATLRQLLEDAEKNELSDIAMVRISILLSTVNQIVREDLSKERPPQGIMRRLSMLVPNNESVNKAPAPWVRSNQAMEEYERGHTTTIADIEKQIDQRKQSPSPPRAPSPQLTLLPVDGTITENAMTAFTEFETAQNLSEILHAFDRLLLECGVGETDARTPLRVYNHVKSGLYTQFAFRQKQLFRLLDAKLATDVYKRQPCLQKRVCVVGCGPVGLRAAVELALLGAQVVVVDKRKLFSRENILHMWPWVVQDLTSLGAKVFFPQFCHSSAYFHVGTRQLQCILLKVALLLGVKVYPGTSFEGLAAPDSIVSDRKSFYTVVTKPQIPWMEFTAVLGACGTKDKLSAHAGIKRFVFSRKEAIGLVCYFPNLGTNEEKKVKEFSWTIQFKQRMFAKMREIGIDLENIVYYRGEYHYIVMTPKRSNLLAQGVLKINYPIVSDLVAVENIDAGALNDYVARIINFFEIPQKSEFARVRLFDFSSRTRAAQAANVLSSRGKKLYVGLIGDALMEPFWPEGLGTCRGFLSAMDACWMVAQIGKQSDEQILADRELGYRIMQHISGFQRDDLQKNVRKYNVDPTSRYTVQYPAAITY